MKKLKLGYAPTRRFVLVLKMRLSTKFSLGKKSKTSD